MARVAAIQGAEAALRTEREQLDRELIRLAEAVATGGGTIRILIDTMRAKQRQRDEVAAKLEHASGVAQADLPSWHGQLSDICLSTVGGLQTMLAARGDAGRLVLRTILTGPIVLHPELE